MSTTDTPTAIESPGQPGPRLVKLAGLLDEWQADAEAAHQARVNGVPRGPVTGFPHLDADLGGCLHPGINVLHGGPGVGKTAFALQVAASCGCPALFVTCEMGTLELFRRVTARTTETFLGRLKSGELPPARSFELARQAAATAPHLAFLDATQAFASPALLRDAAAVVRGNAPHILLVVDSLHSWAEAGYAEAQEYEALNAAVAGLRALGGELRGPVLAIAERNRASMETGGLHAGAGSRKIEYGGEAVIGLAAPKEDIRPDAAGEVEITVTVHKNRHGATGTKHKLRWHGALQRFREV